jgi:hypothetical protein
MFHIPSIGPGELIKIRGEQRYTVTCDAAQKCSLLKVINADINVNFTIEFACACI